jgi:large subunit ribosomal protein L24
MKIHKGDTVKILVGKDSGRQGRVLKVLSLRELVVIEGANVYKKHFKGDGKKKQSGIIDIAKPMSISNVMVICPSCGKPTRVGYKGVGAEQARICKRCGKTIDSSQKGTEDSETKQKVKREPGISKQKKVNKSQRSSGTESGKKGNTKESVKEDEVSKSPKNKKESKKK